MHSMHQSHLLQGNAAFFWMRLVLPVRLTNNRKEKDDVRS
jgi:hypothetical protein